MQRWITPVAFAATALLLTTACSKAEPLDETHNGELTDSDEKREEDNSPFDEYEFRVQSGMNVRVEMRSTDFDPYLMVANPDGSEAGQNDDCTPGDYELACVEFTAENTGKYTVIANSFSESGRGEYTVHIVTTND